ncbi:HTH_Tnp_Tc3_2 domain-containing protein [Trichonephila clavipes]|nr:HTH_Tnp_Tc3_2 domain-containing protein [Trichonephila clavipes]
MRLSQAVAARCLNVSRSVTHRLWNQYQTKACVQETCYRPTRSYNTCRRPFYRSLGPKEKKDFFAATCCRPLCSIREKNSMVRMRLHNSDLIARRPVVCVPLNRRLTRARLSWAREHVSWTR